MVPMLLDSARAPATVRYSVPWVSASWKTPSERCISLGMTTGVDGVTFPSESAEAMLMTFWVDPGSKTSVKAVLDRLPVALPTWLGSKVGYDATASSRPVLTSWTTTVPESASVLWTAWARAFWAYHWMLELIVSWTSWPGTAGVIDEFPSGMAPPPAACS